ncbi:MFS transporter [Streptomyces sp. BA2]|uniref:MFS transporter n=1 Tax=Streptomyces sp. BA2 TaxID=436595 RepID=UPI003014347D
MRHRDRTGHADRRPRAPGRWSRRDDPAGPGDPPRHLRRRAPQQAFGLYGAVLSLGSVLGPLLGGVLTEADRLDLTGMLLSALAVVLIVFPLTEGHAHHWPLWCFAMLGGGFLVLGVFLRHQQRRKDDAPLVVLSLFKGREYSGGLSAQLMLGSFCGLFFMTWTQYLQRGLRMSPFQGVVAFMTLALGELAGATVAMKTSGRFGRRLPQTGVLIALGSMAAYGLQVFSRQGGLTLLAMTVPLLVLGFGLGTIGGPIVDMSLARVPHESAGSASGLFNTAMHLGVALGTALTALVFFSATGGSSEAMVNRDAFIPVLWWAGGVFAVMWALMFALPKHANSQTD